MNRYPNDPGFFGFLREVPLFFMIFGGLIFTFVVGGFLYVFIRGIRIWTSNNASDVYTRSVTVVDKRTEVWGGSGDSSANTNYYVTFQLDDTTRLELQLRGDRYGLIVVGDRGQLTYQGTRFKEFQR
ncbi:DUF2500 domain-containing protein [Paenibacillus sp. strain BS8-2]